MTEPTVAGPRRPISSETYTGAELETRSARPGAYDAMALPSRMGDRQVAPGAPRTSLPSTQKAKPAPLMHRAAPAAPPAPPPAAVAKQPHMKAYAPRDGSVADRLLSQLRRDGGHHLVADLAQRHSVHRSGIYQFLKPAIRAGALMVHTVGHQDYIALPGYVMPEQFEEEAAAPASTERAPTPFTDAATDLQRLIDSAAGLAQAFAQLEAQTLIVARLMGDAIARLSPPPASPFPTAV